MTKTIEHIKAQYHREPWTLSSSDYLALLSETGEMRFGEYDNLAAVVSLLSEGYAEKVTGHPQIVSGVYSSLNLRITAAGRDLLKREARE